MNGTTNLGEITKKDPQFGKAVEQGIDWLELHWSVRKWWPQFIVTITAEENRPAQLQRSERDLQVLLHMHTRCRNRIDAVSCGALWWP